MELIILIYTHVGVKPIETSEKSQLGNIFSSPSNLFYSIVLSKNTSWIDFENFKNPKFSTLSIIKNYVDDTAHVIFKSPESNILEEKTVSLDLEPAPVNPLEKIGTAEYLISDAIRWGAGLPLNIDEVGSNPTSFKEIIRRLYDANVKVVIFTTPRIQYWWDNLHEEDRESFFSIMNKVSNEYDVEVFYLHDKYFNHDMWADSHHITMDVKGMIYSQDVAKIIVEGIQ